MPAGILTKYWDSQKNPFENWKHSEQLKASNKITKLEVCHVSDYSTHYNNQKNEWHWHNRDESIEHKTFYDLWFYNRFVDLAQNT